ncbi:MAG: hypothetical protein KBD78_10345 [Oligoflexales bacterium]|nr:hypothetical protein [Oligoflexales bacterium]
MTIATRDFKRRIKNFLERYGWAFREGKDEILTGFYGSDEHYFSQRISFDRSFVCFDTLLYSLKSNYNRTNIEILQLSQNLNEQLPISKFVMVGTQLFSRVTLHARNIDYDIFTNTLEMISHHSDLARSLFGPVLDSEEAMQNNLIL